MDKPVETRKAVTQADAEAAVRVLIEWAGDDPDREGLVDTLARVARSYSQLFSGYAEDPRQYLERTFQETGGYDELIVLRMTRMPALLLEAGSIVNRQEELELATPERVALTSAAVAAAVQDFCAAHPVEHNNQIGKRPAHGH